MQDVIHNIPSSDWDLSLKLAVGNQQLAKKLFNTMIASLPTEKKLINEAANNNNLLTLRDLIHKLHGGCCYIGVPKLKYIAKELELAIINNNQKAIDNYINILNEEIDYLVAQQQNF